MHAAVREPYFVPATLKADVLFANMKKQKQPMAVVLDEYGGVTGIVTVHDLVERLVGEFDLDGEAKTKKKDTNLHGVFDIGSNAPFCLIVPGRCC